MVRAKVATNVKKKPADFKRPKRKVGRKAPQAANVTSVAISSRRINMLEQSVLQEKGDAVTHRNLSLQDLMQQMGHYNAHIRQRALQGLRELVATHASNVLANVSVVLERFLPMFVDEEAIVRDAAVSTWRVLVPALVAGKSLKPFAKLIAVYFCSGLTHLQMGVRQDTLRAIGALLDVAPELISVDAGIEQLGRLIENFRDLIAATHAQGIKVTNSYDLLAFKKPSVSASASSTSTAGTTGNDAAGSKARGASKKTSAAKAGALTMRFAALKVLHRLLASTDFSMAAVTATCTDSAARVRTLQSARAAPVDSVHTVLLFPPPRLVANAQTEQLRSVGFWQEKSRVLLQPLLDLWVECFANDDVDVLSDEYVEHMQYIIESVTVVLAANRASLAAAPADDALVRVARRLQDALLRCFPLFPAHNIVHSGDAYLSMWYGINVALAKFACVFLSLPSSAAAATESPQLTARVFTFVVTTFAKYEASDELRALSGTHVIVRALLDVVALLLATADVDAATMRTRRDELLACVTALYRRASAKSVTFRICTAFALEQLATLAPWPAWPLVTQWVDYFGDLLAHLERAHIALGRQCLRAMIAVIKQLPAEFATAEALQRVMANVVAFFSVAPPLPAADADSASSALGKSAKQLLHFDALDADDQMQFVALVYHLPQLPVELLRALASCCKSARVAFSAKSFVMDILLQRRERLDIAHLVSFLMSSVLARPAAATGSSSSSSLEADALHLQLVRHVCHVLQALSLGATLAQILAPSLVRDASELDAMARVERHTLVLLVRACVAAASSARGVVSRDVPLALEQHALALSVNVVLSAAPSTSLQQQSTTARDAVDAVADADRALVADVVELLALYDALFMPLLHAVVGSAAERADAVSSDELAKRLRALQLLVRAPPLAARFVQHEAAVRALLQTLDAAVRSDSTCTAAMNGAIPQLIRQLQGDLALVAVGASN